MKKHISIKIGYNDYRKHFMRWTVEAGSFDKTSGTVTVVFPESDYIRNKKLIKTFAVR